ncbi:MAG: flavodoxin domain-containing protein [Solobacterium sp.]|jgi:flavodoxin short chain|nr:flavodoxin domain-containing protein [Solobacterium sp.]MCH4222375.1 flavodoxin domain-containing protein [Solobacterium sp.]MCH4265116.1 flavodoxin domain-containing protein [Solobacterium sp.]
MKKIAVVYFTGTGNTQELAEQVEAGAKSKGAETELLFSDELDTERIDSYDGIAFGCPASGTEQLNGMFYGSYDHYRPYLKGKRVVLFGSWGWGGGKYMNEWKVQARGDGMILAADPVTCKKKPDEAALQACFKLGEILAS